MKITQVTLLTAILLIGSSAMAVDTATAKVGQKAEQSKVDDGSGTDKPTKKKKKHHKKKKAPSQAQQ